MSRQSVQTTYLEQTDARELRPARPPADVDVVRAAIPVPEFNRFLCATVGSDWQWTDRLSWSLAQWRAWLERPGTETWVAWCQGSPAGYIELDAQAEGSVEIAYFGLLSDEAPWAPQPPSSERD